MYQDLIKLLQAANKIFPVTSSDFRGNHSIVLNKSSGQPTLLLWFQANPEDKEIRAYQSTLDEFEWNDIEGELSKMRTEIEAQEQIALQP